MSRVAYVNGRYVPHARAAVHVEDRGFQFADAVYEVIAVRRGRLIDEDAHLDRLDRSLSALRIAPPMARDVLRLIMREVIRRNGVNAFGVVYLQVSRGSAPRAHAFPDKAETTLVMTARQLPTPDAEAARRGISVITLPDIRWKRCDIKSVSLLPNVLGKQAAVEAGAYEAWLIDADGMVTEGTASNAWIVKRERELVTRHADAAILAGITRQVVMSQAGSQGFRLRQRPFSVAEAKDAPEAFLTSTTSLIKPVIRIDGEPVGQGRIGPVTEHLLHGYLKHLEL